MTTNKQQVPTLEQVEKLETRLVDLQVRAQGLGKREEALTKQITERHVSGNKKDNLDTLTRERREVREQRADTLEALPLLQDQIARDREVACKTEAERRLTGIQRAFESLRQELNDDEARVREAAAAYKAAADRLNERYRGLAMLKAEAGALAARFGVAAPTFAPVVIPAMREGCGAAALVVGSIKFLDHSHVSPGTERDEHHLRTRRTYAEVAGTPGGEILKAAGLKAWPELNAKQREIVESRVRERQAEAATAARFEGEAARSTQRARFG